MFYERRVKKTAVPCPCPMNKSVDYPDSNWDRLTDMCQGESRAPRECGGAETPPVPRGQRRARRDHVRRSGRR